MTQVQIRPGTSDWYVLKENKNGQYTKGMAIRNTDTWLDLGAHIGLAALHIAPLVGTVHSYEPAPDNWPLLVANTLGTPNIIRHNAAVVGNADTSRPFYLNTGSHKASHSLLVKRGRERVDVACENINTILRETGATTVKLDIEGAEVEVFGAIENWDQIEQLVFEYHFNMIPDHTHSIYDALLDRLESLGYTVYANRKHNKAWCALVRAVRLTGAPE